MCLKKVLSPPSCCLCEHWVSIFLVELVLCHVALVRFSSTQSSNDLKAGSLSSFIRTLDLSAWRIFLSFLVLSSFLCRFHKPICQLGKHFELSYLFSRPWRLLLTLTVRHRMPGVFLSFIPSCSHIFPYMCMCTHKHETGVSPFQKLTDHQEKNLF